MKKDGALSRNRENATRTTYFDGIDFVTYGDDPSCRVMIENKRFADYYGLQYNHAGDLFFRVDAQKEEILHGPHVFFSMPGRTYSYGSPAGRSRHHVYVCFKGERINRFLAGALFDPAAARPVHPVAAPEAFYRKMLRLLDDLRRVPDPGDHAEAVQLLESLLLDAARSHSAAHRVSVRHAGELARLGKEIGQNPQKNWDFDAEARRLALSVPHFRRLFIEVNFRAPTRFLIECRLKLAETLLVGTALPVSEIARRCGYADESYFYRLFKKHRNRTMLGYRKEFKL